jgi:lysophospholipid acyltransferase (LPLAT)-like uncharacterized protein
MAKLMFHKLIRKYILGPLVFLIYKTISITWKLTVIEPPEMTKRLKSKEPFIVAHWHGDEIVLFGQIGYLKIATISSTSKDGEMMNTMIHLIGGTTTRGSSTRGGASALKGLIRLVKSGWNSSFAVDGPKGPIYEVKPGVFELSRLAGAPIFAGGVACDKAWTATKSWNKAFFPKPFARVVISWSENPIPPVDKSQDPRSSELASTLKDALHNERSVALKKIAAL